MTWGLQAGETTVISGFPSSGKTSLAMNIAEHVALALKKPVGVFSLEMGALALGIRMICSHSWVNLRAIMAKGARESDFPKMMAAAGQIANSLLFVSQISGLSVYELRARARRLHQEHQIALFVVDYIQLMNAAGNGKDPENRTKEMDAISHGLHDLFKELGCHGLVLSQITDEGKLRDSRAIGQDADGVWRLKPATEQEPNDDALPVKLEIIKQRNGPTGIVDLTFIKPYTRFESAARISDEDVPHDMPRRPYND
jgi:replicative DNA helicase